VSNCEDGDAQAIATKAQEAGLTHVLIKIAHGPNPYRYNMGTGMDRVAPLVNALRTIPDFQVWGWQYTFGEQPEEEVRIAVNLVQQYQLDGLVINAEKEYKRDEIKPDAPRYTDALRQNLEEGVVHFGGNRCRINSQMRSSCPFGAGKPVPEGTFHF